MARLWGPLLLLASLCAGCAHPGAGRVAPPPPSPPALPDIGVVAAGCQPAAAQAGSLCPPAVGLDDSTHPTQSRDGTLSFEDLVALAAASNPDLAIARAQVEAAWGRLVQAGLYFNPLVGWQAGDVGNTRASAAGKHGPTLQQTIITADKLGLARQAARAGVTAADWQAVTRWFDVFARLRTAYYDALAAQREVEVVREQVGIAEKALQAAEKLLKAGTAGRPDVLRARVERDQLRNRLDIARRRAEATWRLLAAAAGQTELAPRPLLGRLEDTVPEYDFTGLQDTVLSRSSEVQAALAGVAEAEGLLARARAEVVPNVTVFVQPLYDFPEQRAGAQVQISAPIPVFNRNQGNILAAQAEAARARAVVHQTELRLVERLAAAQQRYQAAREQAARYARSILPDAQESLKLVLLGYEKGDPKYDYTAVLQAQTVLAQAQLTYVGVLNELQRAVSELEGLLQRGP